MELRKSFFHDDIRWHPDLQEWFCARCGRVSDHKERSDAMEELSAAECALVGIRGGVGGTSSAEVDSSSVIDS